MIHFLAADLGQSVKQGRQSSPDVLLASNFLQHLLGDPWRIPDVAPSCVSWVSHGVSVVLGKERKAPCGRPHQVPESPQLAPLCVNEQQHHLGLYSIEKPLKETQNRLICIHTLCENCEDRIAKMKLSFEKLIRMLLQYGLKIIQQLQLYTQRWMQFILQLI